MTGRQLEPFGPEETAYAGLDPEAVVPVRARLNATLALVKAATRLPWADPHAAVCEENAACSGKDLVSAAESAALWAEFEAEMDRLCALNDEHAPPSGPGA